MGMKWVSVKELLPEENQSVLVTYTIDFDSKRFLGEACYINGQWELYDGEFDFMFEVLAWMPWPDVYEGE